MNSCNQAKLLSLTSCALLVCGGTQVYAQSETDGAADDGSEEIEFIVIGGSDDEYEPAPADQAVDQTAPGEGDPPIDEDAGPLVDYRTEDLDRDYVEPPSDRETDAEELRRFFDLYQDAIGAQSFGEADTLAKRIVELSIRLYGLDSYDSARALTNLGLVQHRSEDYESAQLNYQAAIDIIERVGDRLNFELINPLKGLGAAQLAGGRPDLARETFDRAVHVTHVNEGPHNLLQVEILDALTETYMSVGEVDEALDIQESVYYLYTRKVDMSGEEILAALQRQANWMHRMQYYTRERVAYRQMIRILEKTRGKKDLSLISPLTGLGKSYLFIEPYDPEFQTYQPMSGGEVYLKRALRIAEDHEETNWQIELDARLELGDFYTLAANPNRARRAYSDTWDLLSVDEERQSSIGASLQSTVVLQNINPPKYYNSERTDDGRNAPDSFDRGNIVAAYNISKYGHPTNITVVEAQPPGLEAMERAVVRSVRDLRYRPRVEDGELVSVMDVTYTHDFFYRESDVPGYERDTGIVLEDLEQ